MEFTRTKAFKWPWCRRAPDPWGAVAGVVLLIAGTLPPAGAQEFHVSGTLDGERRFEKKVIGTIKHTDFDVWVKDCNWLIRIEPGFMGDYMEAGCDGDVIRIAGAGSGLKPVAEVVNWEAPAGEPDPRTSIIWSAFAQSCYIKNHIASGRLIPAFSRTFFREPIPASVEWLPGRESLPSRIVYFQTGTPISDPHRVPVRSPPPFENGFTNAIYTVLSFTNFNGMRIPVEFEFNEFQPSAFHPVSSNDISVSLHSVGRVVTAENVCTVTNFLPDLPGDPVRMNDYRFVTADRGYLSIHYETNHWLTKSEVQELPTFKAYTQQEAIVAATGNPIATPDPIKNHPGLGNPLPARDRVKIHPRPSRSVYLVILGGLLAIAALVRFFQRPRR